MRSIYNVYPAYDEEGRIYGWTSPNGTLAVGSLPLLFPKTISLTPSTPSPDHVILLGRTIPPEQIVASNHENNTDQRSSPARKGDPHILERKV
jgi:hypothetical protein